MKTSREMAENVLTRRNAFRKEQKRRAQTYFLTISLFIILVSAVILFVFKNPPSEDFPSATDAQKKETLTFLGITNFDSPAQIDLPSFSPKAEEWTRYTDDAAPKTKTLTLLGKSFKLNYFGSSKNGNGIVRHEYSFAEYAEKGSVIYRGSENFPQKITLPSDLSLSVVKDKSEHGLKMFAESFLAQYSDPEFYVYSCTTTVKTVENGKITVRSGQKGYFEHKASTAETTQETFWTLTYARVVSGFETTDTLTLTIDHNGYLKDLSLTDLQKYDGKEIGVSAEDVFEEATKLYQGVLLEGQTMPVFSLEKATLSFVESDGTLLCTAFLKTEADETLLFYFKVS